MVRVWGLLGIGKVAGWLGRYTYKRARVVANPYPIGTLPFIREPYRMPAFGLRPYPPFISRYYSVAGWIYQRRRTWHGIILTAKRGAWPRNPQTPEQQLNREKFKEAVKTWQSLPETIKNIYNKWRYPVKASGYNRFISWYLKTTKTMAIFWGTLKRSADDPSTIEEAAVFKANPQITYHFQFYNKQAFNMILHKGSGFPENPVEGQIFYDETEKAIYQFNGIAWGRINEEITALVDINGKGQFTNIQPAINYVNSKGGGTIFIKKGTYQQSSDLILYSNIALIGEDRYQTIINFGGANRGLRIIGEQNTYKTNILIDNLKLANSTDNTNGVIKIQYADNIRITNCIIGVNFDSTYNRHAPTILNEAIEIWINNNTFDSTGKIAVLSNSDKIFITNNLFKGYYDKTLEVDTGSKVLFSNNQIRQGGSDNIYLKTNDNVILANTIINPDSAFIRVSASNNMIIGNKIKTDYSRYNGILIDNNGNKNIIQGNMIKGSFTRGIDCQPSGENSISENLITGTSTAIYIASNSNYNAIIGNVLRGNTTPISNNGSNNEIAHNQS